MLEATLRQLILVKNLPRALVQIVLQIVTTPEVDHVNTAIVEANKVRDCAILNAVSLKRC